jgi:alpha-L-fucosidase
MRLFLGFVVAFLCQLSLTRAAAPPAPFGPVPSEAQVAWHELEMYAFCHFTTNTFTGKEWGFGDEDPAIFNPTAFDAEQIVGTLAKCGFKGVILTCKHHDGFCMWPTKTTGHNISKSPWKNGKGDMVKEFADAAKRHRIQFGVYLSPWDRNNEHYGTPRYVEIYREQLRELLTNYGAVFEVWHDGANGGDGYYGGKRDKRSIDRTTYYEWPRAWEMVRKLQPRAVVFSDVGPDVRWVGNERGASPYPNWATFSPVGPDGGPAAPGHCRTQEGSPDGKSWIPAETDVSIRPGWFWHAHENDRVRSPKNLLNLYFNSVGRGTSFLLNVPPDRRGLIHENDVIALTGFKQALDRMFATNLATGAKISADVNRGAGFEPEKMLDDDRHSYWAAPDESREAAIELTLPESRRFSVIRLREPVRLGQRIRRFAVDVRENGAWREWIKDGSSVGPHVLLRGAPVSADAVRVRILESAACPCVSEVSLWLEPAGVPDSLTAADPKALAKDHWKVAATFETPDHPALHAIDGDPRTIWCTHDTVKGEQGPPQSLTIDLGASKDLAAVTVLPRQDGTAHAMVDRYRLEWSADGKIWSKPLEGEFSNLRANPVEQRIGLPAGTKARHLRFTALRVIEKNNVTIAEIGVIVR